jgi:hypothetical protein
MEFTKNVREMLEDPRTRLLARREGQGTTAATIPSSPLFMEWKDAIRRGHVPRMT